MKTHIKTWSVCIRVKRCILFSKPPTPIFAMAKLFWRSFFILTLLVPWRFPQFPKNGNDYDMAQCITVKYFLLHYELLKLGYCSNFVLAILWVTLRWLAGWWFCGLHSDVSLVEGFCGLHLDILLVAGFCGLYLDVLLVDDFADYIQMSCLIGNFVYYIHAGCILAGCSLAGCILAGCILVITVHDASINRTHNQLD